MYLTHTPIDVGTLAHAVHAPARGGLVIFAGQVRDHHEGREVLRLEYSAYPAMAEAECEAVLAEARTRWPVAAELRHRIGVLEVGELAVAVAVAAAHRGEAFEACRWIIDEVKRRVPIWKRESYADGSEAWVDPTAPGGTKPVGEPEPR
jgi:molybdopterin synthase catalytic subunit